MFTKYFDSQIMKIKKGMAKKLRDKWQVNLFHFLHILNMRIKPRYLGLKIIAVEILSNHKMAFVKDHHIYIIVK